MTTNFFSPHPHHDAPTVVRAQLSYALPAVDTTTTWKGGWLISGLAAALAVAALGAVGGVAFGTLTDSRPAAAPVATSAPAPVLVAPAVAVSPAIPVPASPEPTRTINTTRTVVVPAPIAAPVPSGPAVPAAAPIVEPPTSVTPPAPPLGIGTCDLVACTPKPPTVPAPPTNCGIVACHPLPQAPQNPLPSCGDLVACQPVSPGEAK